MIALLRASRRLSIPHEITAAAALARRLESFVESSRAWTLQQVVNDTTALRPIYILMPFTVCERLQPAPDPSVQVPEHPRFVYTSQFHALVDCLSQKTYELTHALSRATSAVAHVSLSHVSICVWKI